MPSAGDTAQGADAKVVLITGCDKGGIGARTAQLAAEKGFRVLAACLTEEGARGLLAGLDGAARERVETLTGDLTDRAVLDGVVRAARRDAACLHAVVNNAGIVLPANVEWATPESYERTFAINFHVPVKLTYELLPVLKANAGRVINVTSVDGFLPLPTNAAYNSSKHALEAFSDTLRCECLPTGLNVSVIEPATMRTPLAMGYFKAWLANFKAASRERTAWYGDRWAEQLAEEGTKNLENIAAHVDETAGRILHALVAAEPHTRYRCGKMAHFFFGPVSMLPDGVRDSLLYAISFPRPPLALADGSWTARQHGVAGERGGALFRFSLMEAALALRALSNWGSAAGLSERLGLGGCVFLLLSLPSSRRWRSTACALASLFFAGAAGCFAELRYLHAAVAALLLVSSRLERGAAVEATEISVRAREEK